MTNEKLILEALVDHAESLADLQQGVAGLLSLILSRVPNFSQEERALLEKFNEILTRKPPITRFKADGLREALFALEHGARGSADPAKQ